MEERQRRIDRRRQVVALESENEGDCNVEEPEQTFSTADAEAQSMQTTIRMLQLRLYLSLRTPSLAPQLSTTSQWSQRHSQAAGAFVSRIVKRNDEATNFLLSMCLPLGIFSIKFGLIECMLI